MKRVGAYSLFASILFAQQPPREIYEAKDQQSLIQLRVVGPQELSPAGAVQVSKSFLSKAEGYKLKVLAMYADSQAAAEEQASCEGSYKQWKILYDAFPKVQFRAAQLISIGDDAVLSVRAADGKVSRRVLNGTDPAKFVIDGAHFEILTIASRTRTKFERCGEGVLEPRLHLKTSAALTPELCEKAMARLAQKLDLTHLQASFRNDVWFLCSPVFYPFSPEPMPTETAYHNSPEFNCSTSCDGSPKCWGFQGRKK